MEIAGLKQVDEGKELPAVRGNRDCLRHMLEQLMNNAAQAIAGVQELAGIQDLAGDQPHKPAEMRAETLSKMHGPPRHPHQAPDSRVIRISLAQVENAVHMTVSDTGPGFCEPGRGFDPFYTMRAIEQGGGLGLSMCFGIVREHGGTISAFNLDPRGAAVVVELPLQQTVRTESVLVERLDKAWTT